MIRCTKEGRCGGWLWFVECVLLGGGKGSLWCYADHPRITHDRHRHQHHLES